MNADALVNMTIPPEDGTGAHIRKVTSIVLHAVSLS